MWIRQQKTAVVSSGPGRPFCERELESWVRALAHPRHFWAERSQNRRVGDWIAEELGRSGLRVEAKGPYRNIVAVPREENYHRASDTPETLDYQFMADVTKLVCHLLEGDP